MHRTSICQWSVNCTHQCDLLSYKKTSKKGFYYCTGPYFVVWVGFDILKRVFVLRIFWILDTLAPAEINLNAANDFCEPCCSRWSVVAVCQLQQNVIYVTVKLSITLHNISPHRCTASAAQHILLVILENNEDVQRQVCENSYSNKCSWKRQ